MRSAVGLWAGLAVRLLAAAIWLTAGIAKILDLEHFRAQVALYKLLPHVLVEPFAYALPFVEVLAGLYLLVGLLTRATAIFTCVLMVAFLVAQIQAWSRGLVLDCGCFGALGQQKVGFWSVARDMALGLPGLVVAIWPSRLYSLDRLLFGMR